MLIETNGIHIHCDLNGQPDAPVVVLSHSLGSSMVMWDPQLEVLEPHFRVLRYDMRGHGQSDVVKGAYTLEMLGQDYVRTARAKGLWERMVVWRHVFRNALPPILTIVGILFGSLLSGAVLTETIFNWPGIGRYATTSVTTLDYPAVMGVTLVAAFIYPLMNTLVDIGYSAIDPRVRVR